MYVGLTAVVNVVAFPDANKKVVPFATFAAVVSRFKFELYPKAATGWQFQLSGALVNFLMMKPGDAPKLCGITRLAVPSPVHVTTSKNFGAFLKVHEAMLLPEEFD
jgi:hypothetical protein